MTTHEIQIVKKTWSIVSKLDPTIAGTLFYTRLFANNPGIKKMFTTPIKEQSAKLIRFFFFLLVKKMNRS